MKVSSPALTALDLVRYPQASGGLDNVATVLSDLGDKIDAGKPCRTLSQDRGAACRAASWLSARSTRGPERARCAHARRFLKRAVRFDGWSSTARKREIPTLQPETDRAQFTLECHCPAHTGDRRMIPKQNIVAWGNVVPWSEPTPGRAGPYYQPRDRRYFLRPRF